MIDRPLHYDLQKKFVRKNDKNEPFNGSINNSFTLCVGKNCPYECRIIFFIKRILSAVINQIA